jgi:hypothetical protein
MGVLTMKVNQFQTDVGKLANCRQTAIHVRSRTTIKWNNSTQDNFLIVGDKTTFDSSFGGSSPHATGVGSPAD